MSRRKLSDQQIRRVQAIQTQRIHHAERKRAQLEVPEAQLAVEQQGTVITNYGVAQIVETASGELARCVARQNLGALVCGDRVIWQRALNSEQGGVITAIQPRHSLLTRPAHGRPPKPLAANLDQIMVVMAAHPPFRLYPLDRYLLAASLTQIPATLVISKIDRLDALQLSQLQQALAHYQTIGYPVLWSSIHTGGGMAELCAALANKTSIFIGPSGAGKSSLIQALLPTQDIRIREVSALTQQGRHTTTASTLYHWPQGGDLIDSPGVRQFELGEVSATQLAAGFVEFQAYLGHCQFNNCRHVHEPHCAVQAAMVAGHIHPQRLASYQLMLQATLN